MMDDIIVSKEDYEIHANSEACQTDNDDSSDFVYSVTDRISSSTFKNRNGKSFSNLRGYNKS